MRSPISAHPEENSLGQSNRVFRCRIKVATRHSPPNQSAATDFKNCWVALPDLQAAALSSSLMTCSAGNFSDGGLFFKVICTHRGHDRERATQIVVVGWGRQVLTAPGDTIFIVVYSRLHGIPHSRSEFVPPIF